MNKKELIIQGKDQWIKALERTKLKYARLIEAQDGEKAGHTCPLCMLTERIEYKLDAEPERMNCYYCIHTSPFGAGKACLYQQSYKNMLAESKVWSDNVLPHINIRLKILDRLIAKLKAL